MSAVDQTAAEALQKAVSDGPPSPALSVQESLRSSRQDGDGITKLAVPGYGGRLVARYRRLPYAASRKIGERNAEISDMAQRELYIAADTLVASCEGTEAHMEDGDIVDLGHKLGKELADYLDRAGATTHREAVFLIFPHDTQVMAQYGMLIARQTEADRLLDNKLLGN